MNKLFKRLAIPIDDTEARQGHFSSPLVAYGAHILQFAVIERLMIPEQVGYETSGKASKLSQRYPTCGTFLRFCDKRSRPRTLIIKRCAECGHNQRLPASSGRHV
jgi:hypothetical protein